MPDAQIFSFSLNISEEDFRAALTDIGGAAASVYKKVQEQIQSDFETLYQGIIESFFVAICIQKKANKFHVVYERMAVFDLTSKLESTYGERIGSILLTTQQAVLSHHDGERLDRVISNSIPVLNAASIFIRTIHGKFLVLKWTSRNIEFVVLDKGNSPVEYLCIELIAKFYDSDSVVLTGTSVNSNTRLYAISLPGTSTLSGVFTSDFKQNPVTTPLGREEIAQGSLSNTLFENAQALYEQVSRKIGTKKGIIVTEDQHSTIGLNVSEYRLNVFLQNHKMLEQKVTIEPSVFKYNLDYLPFSSHSSGYILLNFPGLVRIYLFIPNRTLFYEVFSLDRTTSEVTFKVKRERVSSDLLFIKSETHQEIQDLYAEYSGIFEKSVYLKDFQDVISEFKHQLTIEDGQLVGTWLKEYLVNKKYYKLEFNEQIKNSELRAFSGKNEKNLFILHNNIRADATPAIQLENLPGLMAIVTLDERGRLQIVKNTASFHDAFADRAVPNKGVYWYFTKKIAPLLLSDKGQLLSAITVQNIEYTASTGRKLFINLTSTRYEETKAFNVIVVEDLTKEKEAQERMDKIVIQHGRMNEEVDAFAYALSHDLQEPIRTISGFTGLIQRFYSDHEKANVKEYIGYVVDAAQRMQSLIVDLMKFHGIGSGQEIIRSVDLNEVVDEVIADFSTEIEKFKAQIHVASLPTIHFNRNLIRSVFQNLMGNAIKYQKPDNVPVVKISSEDQIDHWLFSVEDNGIGIDPVYKDRVFKLLQRLHTKKEFEGTGLGLAMCKKIIETYGGSITFEGNSSGGTTFNFVVPKVIQVSS